jgi:diguanylate cyclase (GGDEF)-like protein/PAS domain S-box-containing protein
VTICLEGMATKLWQRKLNNYIMDKSAEIAQALIRCPGLGIYIVQDGKFIYANALFQELTGYTEQELLSINPLELVHPEDRELVREKAIENLKGRSLLPYEYRFIKKNGEILWNLERLTSIEYGGERAAVGSFVDVTERKKAEEALRRSEQNFHDSIEKSPFGINILDKRGKSLYINKALLDIWGYSSVEELEAVPRKQRYTPESYAQHLEILEKRSCGEPVSLVCELSIVRSDGQVRHLSASRGKLLWGGEECFQVVYQDITERKQVEEALRRSEQNFHDSIENSPLGIRILDDDGKALYANRALLDLWGYGSFEELEAVPKEQRYTPQAYAEHLVRFKRRKQGEYEAVNYETSIMRSDGQVRHVSASRGELLWGGEECFQVVYQDITERKQLQEALAKSEERYRTILAEIQEGYYETDLAGSFTFVNDAICSQLGYTREELIGMNYRAYVHKEELKGVYKAWNKVYRTGNPLQSYPFTCIRKDGTQTFLESSVSALRNNEGKIIGFRSISRDVTKHKELERRLAEMATHDALTGLPNRVLLGDRFMIALALSRRTRNRLAVLMLDLDRFKAVNDSMGHDVGDKLLKAVGKRLEVTMRKSDTVARIGGDEFVLLLPQIPHAEEAAKFARRIMYAFREPFVFDGHRLSITTSIGIAVYPEGGKDLESLLKSADTAMYWAKEQGRDIYRLYDGSEAATLLAKRRTVYA